MSFVTVGGRCSLVVAGPRSSRQRRGGSAMAAAALLPASAAMAHGRERTPAMACGAARSDEGYLARDGRRQPSCPRWPVAAEIQRPVQLEPWRPRAPAMAAAVPPAGPLPCCLRSGGQATPRAPPPAGLAAAGARDGDARTLNLLDGGHGGRAGRRRPCPELGVRWLPGWGWRLCGGKSTFTLCKIIVSPIANQPNMS